jgi:hypothetical protein
MDGKPGGLFIHCIHLMSRQYSSMQAQEPMPLNTLDTERRILIQLNAWAAKSNLHVIFNPQLLCAVKLVISVVGLAG